MNKEASPVSIPVLERPYVWSGIVGTGIGATAGAAVIYHPATNAHQLRATTIPSTSIPVEKANQSHPLTALEAGAILGIAACGAAIGLGLQKFYRTFRHHPDEIEST